MNSPSPQRLISIVGAMTLTSLINGCTLFTPQPKGQIVVQAVFWTLVKKWAEPDAGLPGHKLIVQSVEDHSVIAEKTTDAVCFRYVDGHAPSRVSEPFHLPQPYLVRHCRSAYKHR